MNDILRIVLKTYGLGFYSIPFESRSKLLKKIKVSFGLDILK